MWHLTNKKEPATIEDVLDPSKNKEIPSIIYFLKKCILRNEMHKIQLESFA